MRDRVSVTRPKQECMDDSGTTVLARWLQGMRETVVDRPPGPDDERGVRRQLAAAAATGDEDESSSSPRVAAALDLWRAVYSVVEDELDLFSQDEEAQSILAEAVARIGTRSATDPAILLDLIRSFLAAEDRCPVTPEAFGARLRRQPPDRLELPDGVTLSGASLAGFLESAHFPFGQYRVGEEQYFVTPSLRLGAEAVESLVRRGPGHQRVGRELLVWQPTSFRVAAGTAAEVRDARPFVGPSGARAYLWLGPVLPGGPLVLRDANNVETRVPVPEELDQEDDRRQTGDGSATEIRHDTKSASRDSRPSHSLTPPLPHSLTPRHPALLRAEEAFQRGDSEARAPGGIVERHLREVMSSPLANGEALSGAGRLWQALGRLDVASAAFTMALERGSVEGALGLSQLAEAMGEGIEAAARPLDAAVARNLRSAELHARYAELLSRLSAGWDHAPQVEWHRRRAEDLMRSE
jgi:hypothetical protein